jgi:hypothetical protein
MRAFIFDLLIGAAGFEPTTFCAQGRRATRLRYAPLREVSSLARPREASRPARRGGQAAAKPDAAKPGRREGAWAGRAPFPAAALDRAHAGRR